MLLLVSTTPRRLASVAFSSGALLPGRVARGRRSLFTWPVSLSPVIDVDAFGRLRPAGLARHFDTALWAWPVAFERLRLSDKAAMMVAERLTIAGPDAAERAGCALLKAGRPPGPADAQPRIKTWISDVGKTSITIDAALVDPAGDPIATASRAFVMVDPSSEGGRVEWTAEERAALAAVMERAAAAGEPFPDVPPTEQLSHRSRELDTRVEDSQWSQATTLVQRQRLLPHHVNVSDHVCHTHFLEFAHSSHLMRTSRAAKVYDASMNFYGAS